MRSIPSFLILEIEAPSLASVASMIRWPTISRKTLREIGTTMPGMIGAMKPPSATADFMYQGRKEGTFGARALRLRAATFRSSGRMTPSTKPTVKSRPLGSFSTPASCAAEASTGTFAPSVSQWRTSLMVSSARSWGRARGVPSAASAGGTMRACEVSRDTAASPWKMRYLSITRLPGAHQRGCGRTGSQASMTPTIPSAKVNKPEGFPSAFPMYCWGVPATEESPRSSPHPRSRNA